MFKFLLPSLLVTLFLITKVKGQCAKCEAIRAGHGGGGSTVRHVVSESSPVQYESTVTRYESQPVYYPASVRTEERYYPASSPQVVYSSQSRSPQYETVYYESQPVVSHRRVVSSEPYPYSSNSGGTRYYTQSQPSEVVYRQTSGVEYSPCAGSSPSGGGRRTCA